MTTARGDHLYESDIQTTNKFEAIENEEAKLNNVMELSVYLAEREQQSQSLVHSLKGKFIDMKFSSDDLIKQRRAETLLEGR